MVLMLVLIAGCNKDLQIRSENYCEKDNDCIAGGSCCHPNECVNKEFASYYKENYCENPALCTMDCNPCPVCKCIDNKCIKIKEISIKEGDCC